MYAIRCVCAYTVQQQCCRNLLCIGSNAAKVLSTQVIIFVECDFTFTLQHQRCAHIRAIRLGCQLPPDKWNVSRVDIRWQNGNECIFSDWKLITTLVLHTKLNSIRNYVIDHRDTYLIVDWIDTRCLCVCLFGGHKHWAPFLVFRTRESDPMVGWLPAQCTDHRSTTLTD